jgi:hypothetical protein
MNAFVAASSHHLPTSASFSAFLRKLLFQSVFYILYVSLIYYVSPTSGRKRVK